MSLAALVPIGPGEVEAARAALLLESLYRHEPEIALVVAVDDEPGRRLGGRLPAPPHGALRCVANPRSRRVSGTLSGLCVGVLAGLAQLVDAAPDPPLVLRIDTDALVIAPFEGCVRAALADRQDAGVAGSYHDAGPDGARDWGVWEPALRHAAGEPPQRRRDRLLPARRRWTTARRALFAQARANGYRWGEHSLGGACFYTPLLVGRLRERGLLADPRAWMHTRCSDDVMMGVLCRALGLGFLELTGPDGPMSVAQGGLNDDPEAILAKGRAIVHSIRDDPRWSEDELRRRLTAGAAT
jgi:hypothetical protein